MQAPASGLERKEEGAGGAVAHDAPGVGKRTLVEQAAPGEPGVAQAAPAGSGGSGDPHAAPAPGAAASQPASPASIEMLFGQRGAAHRYPALGAALAKRSGDAPPDMHDAATAAVESKGSGSPVDGQVAAKVGAHLGADFSGVRVHSDPLSQEATSAMHARAFAHGSDVFLGPKESGSDLGLMAHELTHVAQQGAAGQRAPQRRVQVGESDSPAEREADRVSGEVTSGAPPAQLVVDTAPQAPGQMHKNQFIEQLRAQVTAAASEELGPIASGTGCPTIEHYFSRYAGLPATAGVALLHHFAPATRNARTAADMIAPMVARVREGVRAWRETGQTPRDLVPLIGESPAGGGAVGAAGQAGPHAAQALRAPDGRDTLASLEADLGPGAPVDSPVAARLASPLGVDLASARIHTGPVAAAKAAEVGAPAFAVGNQIVLGADAPAAGAPRDTLLAHELAHVAQQQGAAGDPVARRQPIGAQDAGAEHAADEAVHDAVRAPGQAAGAMRTELRVQRGGKPGATSRPGEKWPGGPITALKSTSHTLADYVSWIRTAEKPLGGPEATIRAMRRLYYSAMSGATAGGRFDAVIAGNNSDAPMYAPVVPATTIDRLFETASISTPRGEVDVSHLFAVLDLRLSGATTTAQAGALRYGLNLEGMVTWLGDLASWFMEWDLERRNAADKGTPWPAADHLNHLNALVSTKVAKDDLLGDMDGEVSTGESTQMSVYPTEGMPAIINSADMPLSQMLEQYYEIKPQTGGRGTQSNRFHHFVHNAQPGIPHSVVSSSPLQVALAGGAKKSLADQIANQAAFFIDHGYTSARGGGSTGDADVAAYRPMVDEIAQRFTNFLTTGLASGDAPWP